MKVVLALLVLVGIAAASALAPIRPYMDFQVLYHADMGLRRGIGLYDHAGQVGMIAALAGVSPEQVFVLPFPYPPWYALSTVWLTSFPIDVAARIWFGLSALMLLLSAWLLTDGFTGMRRAALLVSALLWLPVPGSLLVGQFGFPVLLGAAVMLHALRRQIPLLVALSAALLSLKPHLGIMVILLVGLTLLMRNDRFARKSLFAMLVAAAILAAAGFLASPNWPAAYIDSLALFQGVGGVAECTQCVSLPVLFGRLTGGGLRMAAGIGIFVLVLCCTWLVGGWRRVSSRPAALVAGAMLVTLLSSPYLLNYDFTLLLVPFFVLAVRLRSPSEWIALALAYLLPIFGLAFLGAAGNASLVISALILAALGLRDFRHGRDEPAGTLVLDDSRSTP